MAMFLRVAAFACGLYLLALAGAFITQRHFIYAPDTARVSPKAAGLKEFVAVAVEGKNDPLTSWWRPPSDAAQPVIIHFHGNGGALAGRAEIYAQLAKSGAGVLAVGYPGYGGNPGSPNEEDFYEAAQRNYNWLIARGYPADRIVIAGQSLGSGPALWLAAHNAGAGLVLEAPYTALTDIAARQMPIFPARLVVNDKFDNLSRVADIDMPLVLIHGRRDALIPFEMGQTLFDAAKSPKCAFPIAEADHNDLWQYGVGEIVDRQAELMVTEQSCEASR